MENNKTSRIYLSNTYVEIPFIGMVEGYYVLEYVLEKDKIIIFPDEKGISTINRYIEATKEKET